MSISMADTALYRRVKRSMMSHAKGSGTKLYKACHWYLPCKYSVYFTLLTTLDSVRVPAVPG